MKGETALDVKFRCPNCGSVGLAAIKYVGHLVPCPKCRKGVSIPRTASITAADELGDESKAGLGDDPAMDAANAEKLRLNCRMVFRLSLLAFFGTLAVAAGVAAFGTLTEFVLALLMACVALSALSMALLFVYAGQCIADIHSHFRISGRK